MHDRMHQLDEFAKLIIAAKLSQPGCGGSACDIAKKAYEEAKEMVDAREAFESELHGSDTEEHPKHPAKKAR